MGLPLLWPIEEAQSVASEEAVAAGSGAGPTSGPSGDAAVVLNNLANIFQLKLRSLGLGLDSGISGISGLAPTRTHSGRSGFSGWLWRYLWTWRERRLSSTHS